MHHIVFKFAQGLGNRFCNLMNMFYIHDKYPNCTIYINWVKNNHCDISIEDIFDLSQYPWIKSSDEYYRNIFPTYRDIELWATTSTNEITRWDNIEEWQKHKYIVSITFNLYKFVSTNYCIQKFNSLIINKNIINIVNEKVNKYNINNKFIHFRNGDLIKLLYDGGSSNEVNILKDKVKNLDNSFIIFEYNKIEVDRRYNDVIESVADLIFLSKYANLSGYCPYSHFSSWIFLLSSKFVDNKLKYPIFNCKIIDLILL